MTRHWLSRIALAGVVIVLGAVGLAEVGAQQESRKLSLAERLVALREAIASEEHNQEKQSAKLAEQPTKPNTPAVRSNAPKQRPTRSWRGAIKQQHAQVESTKPQPQRSRSKNQQLLPSFDPLKLLPFRSSQEKTITSSARRPNTPQSNVSSRHTRFSTQSRTTRQSPKERGIESTDGLRGITGSVSIAETPELVEDTPITALGDHGSTVQVKQPIKADDLPAIDMEKSDSTPVVSSRRRRSLDAARSTRTIDSMMSSGRRSPLRLEVSEPVPAVQDVSDDYTVVDANSSDSVMRDDAIAEQTPVHDSVLFTETIPTISTQVSGPSEIIIGQQAEYRILLRNNGRMDASGVVVEIDIPSSTEVAASESSNGFAQRFGQGGLEWQIHQLPKGETAALNLTLIPRSSKPLTLGVTVRTAPLVSQTVVTVQEPKIELSLQGPAEVLFGESEVYRLRVSNPGTGPARNVVLHLIPPGGGAEQQTNHTVGLLPAGKIETFEIELTARDAGQLRVAASAEAEGGLRADCEKSVFVRRPELAVEAEGLRETYAGTVAAYRFMVRNNGTADAEQVSLTVQLPQGAQLVEASEGHHKNTDGQSIVWDIGALPASQDYVAEMRCLVNEPGDNEVVAVAQTAIGGLLAKTIQTTNVVALADLKLEISDPSGPVAVGSEAMYQIRVLNRGSNTAKAIQIVALFSDGVDPVAVDGGQSTVRNGRIAFRTINSLAPGRDVTLRIRAIAKTPGTHVFRAEVLCSELETKLSSEETTRYFTANFGQGNRASTAKKPTGVSSR